MDWKDIEVAAKPINAAYTANQLLGHVLILLERSVPTNPFADHQLSYSHGQQASQALRILDSIWMKHLRRPANDDIAVFKAMEHALDKIEMWFSLGLGITPSEVIAEREFNQAAEKICHGENVWLPGTFIRFEKIPTQSELDAAYALTSRDARRLDFFESTGRYEWLSQAAVARIKRMPWEQAAETFMALRQSISHEIPDSTVSYLT